MKDKKEYSNEIHNQLIVWTGNCDSKASFILAFVGIIIPVLLTNDYVVNNIERILKEFLEYWRTNNGTFSLLSTLTFIALCATMFFMTRCIVFLINTLKARLTGQNGNNKPSIIFFKAISELKYEEYYDLVYKKSEHDYLDDKLRQIHICASICSMKFSNYNKGINALKYGVFSLLLFMIFVIMLNI